ncbi:MAG: hypothetical protein LBV67_09400, partial [Streptococcaceae bacterium]|nr:hypothetical protein [Streptococcaceae bacterium]
MIIVDLECSIGSTALFINDFKNQLVASNMARQYVSVTANSSTKMVDAPSFTEESFHGRKGDPRNKVPKTHEMDRKVVRCIQVIHNWASATFPSKKISIVITSTKRTQAFQLQLKEGGATTAGIGGPHVLGIAVDLVIKTTIGLDLEIIKEFNTQIRDKGSIYQKLRKAGLGGIGLYGAKKGHFCHVDTRDLDTPSLPRPFGDSTYGPYSFWKLYNPLFKDSAELDEEDTSQDILPMEQDTPCLKTYTSTVEGLSTGNEITMQNFISSPTCTFSNNITANDVLDFVHEGISNRERIFNALSLEDRIKYAQNEEGNYN